ncbi:MAG: hypothetical protein U9Q80_05180 [Bacillota bacterium]|nr:hypothetical protein [Bacillota bacterium]
MMDLLLISIGISFVIWGVHSKRKENEFDEIFDEVVNNSDDGINDLYPSADIVNVSDDIVERLKNIENRIDHLEEKKESECRKLINDMDIKNKSVDEISKLTGMNKGEILLLKRFSKE